MTKQNHPKVSIIMPVYNSAKYVSMAINSVLCQTFDDFEFLIVNDGSSDNTFCEIERYKDSRIIFLDKSHGGITAALNIGINFSKGKYLARQDADDFSLPNRLVKEVDFLENNPDHGMVGVNAQIIDEDSKVLGESNLPIEDHSIKLLLLRQNCFYHGAVTIRKSALSLIGNYRPEFVIAQDYDLWLRISEKWKLHNLPDIEYQYRINPNSITHKMKKAQKAYRHVARCLAKQRINNNSDFLMQNKLDDFKRIFSQALVKENSKNG